MDIVSLISLTVTIFFSVVGGVILCVQFVNFFRKPGGKFPKRTWYILAGLFIISIGSGYVYVAKPGILSVASPNGSIVSPTPTLEAPLYQADFEQNPSGWTWNDIWQVRNGYLNSKPIDTTYQEITVPFTPKDANYSLEVAARVVDNNHGKGEFGIIIHDDGSDSGGYQGGVAFPYSPVNVFMDVTGRTNGDDYTYPYNPGADFVTYKIQVKNNLAAFYVNATPFPSKGVPVTNFPEPGAVTIWEQGGAEVNISTLTIMET